MWRDEKLRVCGNVRQDRQKAAAQRSNEWAHSARGRDDNGSADLRDDGFGGLGAQKCSVKPVAISLGQTVRVSCQIAASSARLNGRTVPMFRQTNGSWFGLMPVAVADVPGTYSVEFLGEDGGAVSSAKLTIRATKFPTQNVVLAPQIEALHSTPEDIETLTAFRKSVSDERYWENDRSRRLFPAACFRPSV